MSKYISIIPILVLLGCAAKSLKPGAEKVFVSNEKPGKKCKFVADVTGGQGNW